MVINRDSICLKCAKLRIVSKDGPSILVECKDELHSFPIKPGNSCRYFVKMMPDEMKRRK